MGHQAVLPHPQLPPLLPAPAHHCGVVRKGHLVPEPGPVWGPGALAEENEGDGDGRDSAGDIHAVLHAHQLSPVSALPAVSRGGRHHPGGCRWLLRHVPGVLVCGQS